MLRIKLDYNVLSELAEDIGRSLVAKPDTREFHEKYFLVSLLAPVNGVTVEFWASVLRVPEEPKVKPVPVPGRADFTTCKHWPAPIDSVAFCGCDFCQGKKYL